jgi:hypothetical protein
VTEIETKWLDYAREVLRPLQIKRLSQEITTAARRLELKEQFGED